MATPFFPTMGLGLARTSRPPSGSRRSPRLSSSQLAIGDRLVSAEERGFTDRQAATLRHRVEVRGLFQTLRHIVGNPLRLGLCARRRDLERDDGQDRITVAREIAVVLVDLCQSLPKRCSQYRAQNSQNDAYQGVLSPALAPGLDEISHPFTTSWRKPFLSSRSR